MVNMKLDDLFINKSVDLKELATTLKIYTLDDFWEHLPSFKDFKNTYYLVKSEVLNDFDGNKIIDRIFAFTYRKGNILWQEVIRKFEDSNLCLVKNMYLTSGCAAGYHVAWNRKTKNYYFDYEYDLDIWYEYDKRFGDGLYTKNITTKEEYQSIIDKRSDLKYLSWNFKGLLSYLVTVYKYYPELEVLEKLDLPQLINATCLNYIRKNKSFVSFLFKHKNDKQSSFIDFKKAYLENKDSNDCRMERLNKIYVRRRFSSGEIKNEVVLANREKINNYLERNNIDIRSYADMIKAMELFEVDFNDTKNIMPRNFKEIHDRYCEAYHLKLNKDLNDKLKIANEKYKALDLTYKQFHFKLPKEKCEFIDESKRMDNCVGYMNYDERMANGKILIVFIRDEQDNSLATMEFNLDSAKVVQLRAKHNSKVSEELEKLVNKVWLPKAKKFISKMQFKET